MGITVKRSVQKHAITAPILAVQNVFPENMAQLVTYLVTTNAQIMYVPRRMVVVLVAVFPGVSELIVSLIVQTSVWKTSVTCKMDIV